MNEPKSVIDFKSAAYARTGQTEPYEDVAHDLAKVSRAAVPERNEGYDVLDAATSTVWELGSNAMRTVVALDSIVASTPPWNRGHGRNILGFDNPAKLADHVRQTNDSDLAVSSLAAVGAEYRSWINVLPSHIARWAVELSKTANDDQQQVIGDALEGIRFSDRHIDSVDTDDCHPITAFLLDQGVSPVLQKRLLGLAYADIQTTGYKPWAWRSQLNVTLRALARQMNSPLRFEARKQLDQPESDAEYGAFQYEQKTIRKSELAIRRTQTLLDIAVREATTKAHRDAAKAIVEIVLEATTKSVSPVPETCEDGE
jgi:hypothetical protein